jgi:exonuclease SbcC
LIKKVVLKNLLSHKNSVLEFVPGLNIIIGETKAGKSAILDGIDWFRTGRPPGDTIRSNWGGQTNLSVTNDSGRMWRTKGDDINEYGLNGQRFTMDKKKTPPQEILNALNINEINFKDQFSSHFLLTDTPGKVAEHYNQITHLDFFDDGRQKIQKWITGLDQKIKDEKQEEKRLNEALKNYEDIPEIEKEIEHLEQMEKNKKEIEDSTRDLENLLTTIRQVKEDIDQEEQTVSMEKEVNDLIGLIEKKRELESQISQIGSLLESIEKTSGELEKEKQTVSMEKDVDELIGLMQKKERIEGEVFELDSLFYFIDKYEKEIEKDRQIVAHEIEVDNLLELAEKRDRLQDEIESLSGMLEAIETAEMEKDKEEKKLTRLTEKYNQFAGQVCPVCGGAGQIEKE